MKLMWVERNKNKRLHILDQMLVNDLRKFQNISIFAAKLFHFLRPEKRGQMHEKGNTGLLNREKTLVFGKVPEKRNTEYLLFLKKNLRRNDAHRKEICVASDPFCRVDQELRANIAIGADHLIPKIRITKLSPNILHS